MKIIKKEKIRNTIPIIVAVGFVILCIISWIDEFFDLPHLLLNAPRTPFNWREAFIETFIIGIVAVFTIWWVFFIVKQHARLSEALSKSRQELAKKNKELKKLNQLKNKFVGIAAHDLKNPLMSVQLMASLLSDQMIEGTKEKQIELIKRIQQSIDFMIELVNDLLDIAKIEAGKLKLYVTENDYVEFVNKSVEPNKLIAGKKGITIKVKTDAGLQKIYFDKYRINQLLNNLLDNAIKYSFPDTEIIIEISRQKNSIFTKVIDKGPGIPQDEIANIFYEYYEAGVKPGNRQRHAGLGLAIAKKIVEEHKGKIGVESEPGKGATFYFSLPCDYLKR